MGWKPRTAVSLGLAAGRHAENLRAQFPGGRIIEVWIVDIKNDAIHVYREPKEWTYTVVETRGRRECISPRQFPDFLISGAELLG